MNMTPSRSCYPASAQRAESERRRTEEIPPALETELHRLTVPAEHKTPRGRPFSGAEMATVKKLRDLRARPYNLLWRVSYVRIERGEDYESVVVPLRQFMAALRRGETRTFDELTGMDEQAEMASRLAKMLHVEQRSAASLARVQECEALEIGISEAYLELRYTTEVAR